MVSYLTGLGLALFSKLSDSNIVLSNLFHSMRIERHISQVTGLNSLLDILVFFQLRSNALQFLKL